MATIRFFKMLIMMHCDFIWGRHKSKFSKNAFGRRGSQNSMYAFDNVDNSGRPLKRTRRVTHGFTVAVLRLGLEQFVGNVQRWHEVDLSHQTSWLLGRRRCCRGRHWWRNICWGGNVQYEEHIQGCI